MIDFTRQIEGGLLRLYILWRASKQPISGIDILKSEREHGHELSPGKLYPILRNLTKGKYLTVKRVVEHGKVHRYYETTADGRDALKRVRTDLGQPMKAFLNDWLGVKSRGGE